MEGEVGGGGGVRVPWPAAQISGLFQKHFFGDSFNELTTDLSGVLGLG